MLLKNKIFNKIKKIINEKEVVLLSLNNYENLETQFDVKCKNNHFFKTCWGKLRNKNWCKQCLKIKGK